jgi:hypothetical protein
MGRERESRGVEQRDDDDDEMNTHFNFVPANNNNRR